MLYDRIALEKHFYVATKAERIQNSKHWILTLNTEGPQQPLNQRLDFAQAKRACKRLHDEHQARTQEEYRTIPRSQQLRQRKGQQFEGNEEYDYAVDPKTVWRFHRGSRWNLQTTSSRSRANLQTASSSSSKWDQTHWKTSKWNSQHSSSPDDWWTFFSELGQVSVAWRKTSSQPTGGVNSTFTNTACTELHSMITFRHANTRTRVAQELESSGFHIFVSPKLIVIHVSRFIPCRTWHWPQAQVLSQPSHLLLLSFWQSHQPNTRPMALDPYLPCDVPRQSGGSTQIPTHTTTTRKPHTNHTQGNSTNFSHNAFQKFFLLKKASLWNARRVFGFLNFLKK